MMGCKWGGGGEERLQLQMILFTLNLELIRSDLLCSRFFLSVEGIPGSFHSGGGRGSPLHPSVQQNDRGVVVGVGELEEGGVAAAAP